MGRVLAGDRDAFLFILPSIRQRFDELWSEDRGAFYNELSTLFAGNQQRKTLLFVAARVPYDRFAVVDDLLPLIDAQDDGSRAAVRFVVRILLYEIESGREIISGENARPWSGLTLEMARRLPRHEHDALLMLQELTRSDIATPEQLVQTAEASRLALVKQLDRAEYAPMYVRLAIWAFMRTYDIDPPNNRPVLERLLEPARIAIYGKFELEAIASEAKRLHDESALEAIYHVMFADITVPDETITIGAPSVLMGFVQDARQSIQMARWSLGQRFAAFLEEHPRGAIRALTRVVELEAREGGRQEHYLEVPFRDGTLRLLYDNSNVWDSEVYQHEDWWTMVQAFETRLRETLSAGDISLFDVALEEIPAAGNAMFLWRVLVRNAGLAQATSSMVLPMITNGEILRSYEFGKPISEFLRGGYANLPTEHRVALREALLALPDVAPEDAGERYQEHLQDLQREYVLSIPADALDDDRLCAIVQQQSGEVDDRDDEPAARRALILSGSYMGAVTTSRIPIQEAAQEAGASDELAAAIAEAQPYQDTQQSVPEGTRSCAQILRDVERLSRNQAENVRQAALDVIAMLLRRGLELETFSAEDRAEFLPLSLEVANGAHPDESRRSWEERELDFARHPSWGSPSARYDGVQVLWQLYRLEPQDAIAKELRRRSADPDPAVRYLTIREAGLMRDGAPELGWELASAGISDPNISVLPASVHAINVLGSLDADRRNDLLFAAADRVMEEDERNELRLSLFRWLLDRGLYHDDERAMKRLRPLLEDPWSNQKAASELVFELANRMAPSVPVEKRRLVAATLLQILRRLLAKTNELSAAHGFDSGSYPEAERVVMETTGKLLNEIAQRLYSVSGILQQAQAMGTFAESGVVDSESFVILQPLLTDLGTFPWAGTAYYVLKTLSGAMEAAPRDVLLLGIAAIKNGIRGGLLYENLAEDDVRLFVTRYIREYRGLLESDRGSLSGLMDIVDAYVDAGWPKWLEVVTELDNIYRAG